MYRCKTCGSTEIVVRRSRVTDYVYSNGVQTAIETVGMDQEVYCSHCGASDANGDKFEKLETPNV